MGKSKFQPSWVNAFPWVAPLKGDTSKAYCTICKKTFRIGGCGKSQGSSHCKSNSIKDVDETLRKSQLFIPINEFSNQP